MPQPIEVLISLFKGYGMGDGVQMSAVLRHVAKYRPDWNVTYKALWGQHKAGNGIVARTLVHGEEDERRYHAEIQIRLYDTFANWHDRPNTRVSSCLHECFGLGWDAKLGRYQINVSKESRETAGGLLHLVKVKQGRPSGNWVGVHYEGNSAQARKNLTHKQAIAVCRAVERRGRIPLLLDWQGRSPLPHTYCVAAVGGRYGLDPEMNAAVIARCEAFVGIDSGPGKCASATDTPSLIVWHGHHPAVMHDPAPNTTHLVPAGYHGLQPVCNDPGVIKFFEEHYNTRTYTDDLVTGVESWLEETLR